MLTNAAVAARATPGARLLQTTGNTPRLSLLQPRQLGQTRRFRFGRCSGASETESQASRELRSRQGRSKFRSSSATNRKLSWDHNSGSEGHKTAMKNVMASRYVDADKVKSWSDELSGIRPGRSIEDVERNAINHLFHGDSTPAQYEYDPWQSPFDNMRNYMASKRVSAEAKKAKSKSPSAQNFVTIDPITNRRMPSQDTTITSSMQRADPVSSYAHFTVPQTLLRDNAEMTHSNGPPPPEELNKYDPVKWMEPSGQPALSAEELSKSYSDLAQYGPVSWREPSGAPPATAEEKSKQYNDLAKYKPVEFSEPTGQLPPSAEELSKQYEDLDKYEAIKFNEPHGRLPPTAEEQSKQYADLDKYESVQFNEPHGQLPPTLEELSKKYADLNKYESVQFNEPHGQLPPSAEELSKQYDDLHKYEAVKFNEPDGQLPTTSEELSKRYKDVHHYGPISFNEPAGQLPPTAEELSKQYDDLHKYGPVTFNEPNGQLPPTAEVLSKQYPDLHKYGPVMWNEPDGQLPPSSEVLSKKYQDLHYYAPVQFNEPDGQLPKTAEEKSKVYKDIHQYGPVTWNEPEGKLPLSTEEKSKEYKDLDGYEKPVTWNEPNGQPAEHPEDASKRYDDLDQYQPVRWNEPDGKPPMTPEESSKQYKDLDGYSGPYTHNEPDGKPPKHGASSMNDAMTSYGRSWDMTTRAAQTTLKQAKIKATTSTVKMQPKTTLTGNYVRDFPEDFAVSWSRMLGEQPSPEKAAEEVEEAEIASFDESFPSLSRAPQGAFSTRLEPALNRTLARAQADPYSFEPQGLELSYADEIGARTAPPSFVRMYGTVSDAAAGSKSKGSTAGKSSSDKPAGKDSPGGSAPGPQAPPNPSYYKILAYDPTMQTISTAETTSMVEDTAVPLTPPEVMMRLSNPVKFFPHLGPLQAQGYEIVSGSGDVLVFRRVREAQPGAESMATPGTVERSAVYQAPRVNPIDMMGSQPVTPQSYSASPTGYVNYEDEADALNKPLPPFRTRYRNTRANQAQVDPNLQPETKKSNKGKKLLIGAASVGGLSYAAGVVGEFFQTGGADGKGPNTRF